MHMPFSVVLHFHTEHITFQSSVFILSAKITHADHTAILAVKMLLSFFEKNLLLSYSSRDADMAHNIQSRVALFAMDRLHSVFPNCNVQLRRKASPAALPRLCLLLVSLAVDTALRHTVVSTDISRCPRCNCYALPASTHSL